MLGRSEKTKVPYRRAGVMECTARSVRRFVGKVATEYIDMRVCNAKYNSDSV